MSWRGTVVPYDRLPSERERDRETERERERERERTSQGGNPGRGPVGKLGQ
jgi:hypothetical protein